MKHVLLIVTSAFIAAAIAFFNSEQIPVFTVTDEPRAVSKVDTKKKQVALTFDIGWGDMQTVPILNTLKEKNIEATFFVSGKWAERHPDMVETIAKHQHDIGLHGYAHKDYRSLENEEVRRDIMLAREAVQKASEQTITYLRPPEGRFDEEVLETAAAMNMTVIASSVDSKDITNPGASVIISNVVRNITPGDIILMHASDSAKQTANALPVLIDNLRDEGYAFVTISDLLANAEAKSKLIK